ncbi:MAG: hypothetical protein ACOYYU_01355 [Chloroflexota bacterium]
MDEKTSRHFDRIIQLARSSFEQVRYEVNSTPERSILNLWGEQGQYRIFVTELFSDKIRKYRYYVLRGEWVEAGFDNSPDLRAIRLKYGKIGKEYAGENIPHLHLDNKSRISLTEEMTFAAFVEWIRTNL